MALREIFHKCHFVQMGFFVSLDMSCKERYLDFISSCLIQTENDLCVRVKARQPANSNKETDCLV